MTPDRLPRGDAGKVLYRPPIVANVARLFFALWFIGGFFIHAWAGLFTDHAVYAAFGQTIWIPAFKEFWFAFMLPNMTYFALALAVFEGVVAILVLSEGKSARLGFGFSIVFSLFIVIIGLTFVTNDALADFIQNRLVMLIFAAAQVPLFLVTFEQSFPAAVHRWIRRF